MYIIVSFKISFTMRTNLLNWCHLVSVSKNVVFYAFLVVRIYEIFSKFAQNAVYICKISVGLMFLVSLFSYTANIYSSLMCPLSTAISLYGFYHIQSNVEITLKKTVNQFTIIFLYLEQQLNVIHTAKLQWKVGHN